MEVALEWADRFESELYGSVLPFWMSHAADADHGGFFDCLAADGSVYDTTKHVWLQGRMAFMLARVANEATEEQLAKLHAACEAKAEAVKGAYTTAKDASSGELVAESGAKGVRARTAQIAATRGAMVQAAADCVDFLLAHAVDPSTGHVCFALTADGRPCAFQRKPFSASFLGMALAEVARAQKDKARFDQALHWLAKFREWSADPSILRGAPPAGSKAFLPLNQPMILLNMCTEYAKYFDDPSEARAFMAEERAACVKEIALHWKPELGATLENVLADGSVDTSTPEGRLHNPGHAIEAGWFLMDEGMRRGAAADAAGAELVAKGAAIANASLAKGWDGDLTTPAHSSSASAAATGEGEDKTGNGGIVYFLDALGHDATQLEADMKLWWPICEALIALSMEFAATGSSEALAKLNTVATFATTHFSDAAPGRAGPGAGEWVGYLSRDLRLTHSFKGGPYKGCFHVPRALMMCTQLLRQGVAEHSP